MGIFIASNLPGEWLLTENSCPTGIKYSKCMAVLTKHGIPGEWILTKIVDKMSKSPILPVPPPPGIALIGAL